MRQPCEHCKKCFGGCSWTDLDEATGKTKFEPVAGWSATPTTKISNGQVIHSYEIRYCPEFVDDGTERRRLPASDRRYKYDMEKFKSLMLAGMTDAEIQRRMGGMPLVNIERYRNMVHREMREIN